MSVENYLQIRRFGKVNEEASYNMKSRELQIRIMKAVKDRISKEREIDIYDIENAKKIIRQSALRWIEEEINENFSDSLLNTQERYEIYELLQQNIFGFGVIEPLLDDKSITEIMINGKDCIFYEKMGKIQKAKDKRGRNLSFSTNEELKNVVDKIVAPINRKVDESNPIVDARLPDGSRVNVVLHPISLDGISVTIRKFPSNPYTMEELLNFGSINEDGYRLLKNLVKSRYNIFVSGGTGSGKTTFLNALSMFIPEKDRVITIEDSAELKFYQVENLIRLESRPPNIENKGEIDIRTLVKSALRMRPDRIIVGEIRSGEAIDMLQAMNTGHDGSLSTGHSNSAEDMVKRLETMVLMSGMELPVDAIRSQISTALDFIVHTAKLRDGSRKVIQIAEVQGIEKGEVITKNIYEFREEYGLEKTSQKKVKGQLIRTNERMMSRKKLMSSGNYENVKDLLDGNVV